jgi:hypothetical protein
MCNPGGGVIMDSGYLGVEIPENANKEIEAKQKSKYFFRSNRIQLFQVNQGHKHTVLVFLCKCKNPIKIFTKRTSLFQWLKN